MFAWLLVARFRTKRGARVLGGAKRVALAAALGALLGVLFYGPAGVGLMQPTDSASAAAASDWDAGDIIDDSIFFDANAMSATQIQQFLNAKQPSCARTCLKSYSMTTTTVSPGHYQGCPSGYQGARNESAATMIHKIAVSCGISPEVLLVTLEKEQADISDTSLSSYQLDWAFGCGVPDFGPKDIAQQGFFKQLLCAASRMQYYRLHNSGYGYHPGRNNTILYNPNRACGSKTVYIDNWATAILYIYTPYQPTPAALNYLYSAVPDWANRAPNGAAGCASYGNRNFFRIFTDWFGSTHSGGTLVRASGSATVYALTATSKHALNPTSAAQSAATGSYLKQLGPVRQVGNSYLNSYTTGKTLGRVVADPLSGTPYLVQSNQRHTFQSCAQQALFGYRCGSSAIVRLTLNQFAKLKPGPQVNNFFSVLTSSGNSTWYSLDVATKQKSQIQSWAAMVQLNGGTAPFVAQMDASAAAALSNGNEYYQQGTTFSFNGAEWLIDGRSGLIKVPSAGVAAAVGVPKPTARDASLMRRYHATGATLSQVVACGSTSYFAGGGRLYRLASAAAAAAVGIAPTALQSATCGSLTVAPTSALSHVFISSGGATYEVAGGRAQLVTSSAQAKSLNGGTVPTVIPVSSAELALLPLGIALVPPGTALQDAGTDSTYVIDSGKKFPLSVAASRALGISLDKRITVDPRALANVAAQPALAQAVVCNGTAYFGDAGTLYRLSSPAAADALGIGVTTLSGAFCATRTISRAAPRSKLFITSGAGGPTYLLAGGTASAIGSTSRLAALGGTASAVLAVPASQFPSWSVDGKYLDAGTLIQSGGSTPTVYLADAGRTLLRLYNSASLDAVGMASHPILTGLDPRVFAWFTVPGTPLKQVVQCGSTVYYAAAGTLHALKTNTTGIAPTPLSPSLCGRLTVAKGVSAAAFVAVSGHPEIFEVANSHAEWLPAAAAKAANGGGASAVWTISQRQLDGLGVRLDTVPLGTAIQPAGKKNWYAVVGTRSLAAIANPGVAAAYRTAAPVTGLWSHVFASFAIAKGSLTQVVDCGSQPYFAASGTLVPIKHWGVVWIRLSSAGAPALCARLPKSGRAPLDPLIVKVPGSGVTYLISGGTLHRVPNRATFLALGTGGKSPAVLTISMAEFAGIPRGADLPKTT